MAGLCLGYWQLQTGTLPQGTVPTVNSGEVIVRSVVTHKTVSMQSTLATCITIPLVTNPALYLCWLLVEFSLFRFSFADNSHTVESAGAHLACVELTGVQSIGCGCTHV
eukprot:1190313-Prorocentrum_minimum.AAC.9